MFKFMMCGAFVIWTKKNYFVFVLVQLSARQTECDNRLTEVRNEYLLTLAAVNTHHQHYYTSDLPHIMEVKHTHMHKYAVTV